ncbi:thiol reductant ABC exporter subunit CydD [Phytoactinopolyspora halophila]|uniref:thiol reductant ABC exporter subunit CydD n=1 Tax=Phytoactinopolyspora halophila TaxID=1981511 RepID=UPI001B8BD0DD|nr:thiol reductant ABC exporter subunit CydD [Phytoactinopolyspora halophila]
MDVPASDRHEIGGVLLNALARRLLASLPSAPIVCAALAALAATSAVLIISQAEVLAEILATGVRDQPAVGALSGPLVMLGGILAARAALSWAGQIVAQRAAAAVKSRLRREALAHAQQLGPGWLSGQHSGGITTTLGRGLDALDPYFTGYVPQLFNAAVVPLAVVTYLLTTDLASALIICLTLPLIPVFGVLVGLQTRRATSRQWQALERLGGRFLDLVAGLPTLRAFGRARAQARAVRDAADEHRRATMRTLRVAFLSALVLELVATLSVALVAVPVGLRLLGGELDLRTALVVLLLAPEAYFPLRSLGAQFHASTEGLEVAQRVFGVLDQAPTPLAARPAPLIMNTNGPDRSIGVHDQRSGAGWVIELDEVSVHYPGRETPALDRASLTLAPGERVALVGPSGAGKSTLLGVVLGLVRPDSGRVLVSTPDGPAELYGPAELPTVDPEQWREQLAWVPQRPHLFARTVADNIRLGCPSASDADVERAAALAHADGFIDELPRRYETQLGERGVGLSAGQRQRIALARAFVRDAPLLVLDEPTAGLDAGSESVVVAAAERLMAGRTVLVVAHRPAMVTGADRVLRLEHGYMIDGPGPGSAQPAVMH